MRSLAVKITLALLITGLVGSVLLGLVLWQGTQQAFDQFLNNRDREVLADLLENYYDAQGSWLGIDVYIPLILRREFGPNEPGPQPGFDRPTAIVRFEILDHNQRVIFATPDGQVGQVLDTSRLDNLTQLFDSNDNPIGWLHLLPTPRQVISSTAEGRFIQSIERAVLLSSILAAITALVLGGILAFGLTRSLRELRGAAQELASGNLGVQVPVRSQDEVGQLASAFNQMSTGLQRAVYARRQMTADIAHDLRSPLSVISGYAEALAEGKLPGNPEIYGILHHETRLLSRLIEDLRLLSLADAGELRLNLQAIDPQVLLERLAARHAVGAGQKGITLAVEAAQDLPLIHVDVERMAQVLDNLLLNSLKHTSAGGKITLRAAPDHTSVEIAVSDTGAGIPAEQMPYIFDRFFRGDSARSDEGASGLGLAIARSLVEAHGGAIRAESNPGQGTTFTIRLSGLPV